MSAVNNSMPLEQMTAANTINTNSNLYYDSKNVYTVVSVNADGKVLTSCVWGPRNGEEMLCYTVEKYLD